MNLPSIDGFWYVATPYSKYPGGIEEAFQEACRATAHLIQSGVPCFSPIAHTHPVATYGEMDPFDHGIWLPADEPMMAAAGGLIVVQMDTWDQSYGIGVEIDTFQKAGKPVEYMEWPR